MTMADGSEVEVEHVNPSAGRLLYLNSMPTIFLRMADSTNLLLPIVVGESSAGCKPNGSGGAHMLRSSYARRSQTSHGRFKRVPCV